MMNLPNFLSIIRILLIPILVFALFKWSTGIFLALLLVTGLTDFFDGYLARKLKKETPNGAMLDILADRLLIITLFIALAIKLDLKLILIFFILFRDIIAVIGQILLFLRYKFTERAVIRPTLLGKFTTLIQIITIGLLAIGIGHVYLINITIWLSLITGLRYLYIGSRRLLFIAKEKRGAA